MASAQILNYGKALYAYSGSAWYGLNTTGNLVNATRWQKVATGGETTLSGNDDTGEALSYTPGFEQVFLNGVLLARDLDYTATNGTTITGLTALTAGYIVEVIAYNNINVGNTYTQSQIDNKVANTFTRWVETLSASATVLSGLDDNSNTLSYTPGLEQVYVNGILLLPSEYTATSGSSVVLSEAAVSGDVIQVYTLKNFRVPNTYTIAQTDDQFLTKTSASSTYLSQSSASSTYVNQNTRIAFVSRVNTNQSINNTTWTKIAFDTELLDSASAYDTSNYRFTVPSGQGGNYLFGFDLSWGVYTAGHQVIMAFYVDGSLYLNATYMWRDSGSDVVSTTYTKMIPLNAGQYVEAYVYQNRGSAATLYSPNCNFWGHKI